MKNRIIFWENECLSAGFLNSIVDLNLFVIVGKIQLDLELEETDELFRIDQLKVREEEWDYFLFACPDGEMLEKLKGILDLLGVKVDRYINLFDIFNMDINKSILLSKILKPEGRLYDRTLYRNMRAWGDYAISNAEGLSFVANSTDIEIPGNMFETKKVWAADDIGRLGKLLEKYYMIKKDSRGIFCDIGANIGTTSVYMKRYIIPNYELHAFEPMKENYKLLRTNLILNDISNYNVNNVALAREKTEYNMKKVYGNWGNCSITNEKGANVEQVVSTTLDDYLSNYQIKEDENLVLWIDTEGFEIDVLKGAVNVIRKKPALFFEFNRACYGEEIEDLISLLTDNYSGYISFANEENIVVSDISTLREIEEQTDIFMVP